MPEMSSDRLRDISVAVVEDFINNRTPLSEGLAKQAAAHDLNCDQIQRCVEASNTIAHLKLMSVAEDRTFEFPLCKFAEVMEKAATPNIEKSAGLVSAVTNTFKDVIGKGEAAKALRTAESSYSSLTSRIQATGKNAAAAKADGRRVEAQRLVGDLRVLKADAEAAKANLSVAKATEESARQKAGARVAVGAAGLGAGTAFGYEYAKAHNPEVEKIASVAEPLELADAEAKTFFIKEAAANDRALEDLRGRAESVKNSLLKLASEVSKDKDALYKIACVADKSEVAQVTALVYGAPKSVMDFGDSATALFKQAELKPVATLVSLLKEARALTQEMQERSELQKRASEVRGTLTKEAFASFFKKPVSYVKKSVSSATSMSPSEVRAFSNGQKVGTGVSKTLGIASAPVTKPAGMIAKSKLARGAVVGTALGAGMLWMNSAMVGANPGTNSVTGRSKDVWESLQG